MSTLNDNLLSIYNTKLEIKDAIGTNSDVFAEYPDLIRGLKNGIVPTGTLSYAVPIDMYGPYVADVTSYSYVSVSLGESSAYIYANGQYTPADFGYAAINNNIIVNVPGPSGNKVVTENGNYDISSYASVSVNVESGGSGGSGELAIDRVSAHIEEKDWTKNQVVANISYSTRDNVTSYEFDVVNGANSTMPTLFAYVSVGSYVMRESLVVDGADQIILKEAGTSYSTGAYISGVEYEPGEYTLGTRVVDTKMPGHYEIGITNNGTYATVSGTMARKLDPDSIIFYVRKNNGGNGTYYSAMLLDDQHGFGPEDTGYGKYRISVDIENAPIANVLQISAYTTVLGYATNLYKSASSSDMRLNNNASTMDYRYIKAEGDVTYNIYIDPEFTWSSNNIILTATGELSSTVHGDTNNPYITT